MLLRSSSTPILNQWFSSQSKDSCSEAEIASHIPRNRSISLSLSSSSYSSPSSQSSYSASPARDSSTAKMTRAFSETDLRDLSVPKKKSYDKILDGFSEEEEDDRCYGLKCATTAPLDNGVGLFSSSQNQESYIGSRGNGLVSVLVGGGIGSGGGKICGGGGSNGGSNGGDDGNSGSWDSDYGTDVYYQKMIEANPGNSLLLSNYAKYLKDVRGDFVKAEEYCGRAILSNPNDGDVLSMYGDLIWQGHKDASRAETYFDQAVKASPDDCFVLASYARFLWDSEEDDDEEEANTELSTPNFFRGTTPIAASS
ncbi:uncharacterized protein LOC115725181 [Cannabis sativa]|jgi:hypothetical protein|uniref:Uncharacterized protein n=1 Tax=Cannabis sativa TaxID=3483 RepID=A0A7J6GQG3_CANSA|nr:uncharacterized protein LOC115725181 [Cannabis sativa]KAF4385152.1 hypothetical protein F8388_014285 [Cannabis sativa]